MLAYNFIKNWIKDIWFFEVNDIVEYVKNILATLFGFIPMLFIGILDLVLSPIEIIAIIIWFVRR